ILNRSREAVIDLLNARFETVPDSVAETLNSLQDLQRLKALLVQAIRVSSIAEFQQLLDEGNSNSESSS
ncbi:MAG: transposase, partial [Baaleninema sp.]